MNHPSEIELIELASRRLSNGRAAELMTHISACPACARTLRELEQIHLALGSWRENTSETELVDLVQRRLDAGSGTSIQLFPWWLRSSAVAACVVVSLAGGHLVARNLLVSPEQAVVIQPTIEDQLQLAVLAEPDRTGLSDLLNADSDFDGVIP